MTIDSTQPKTYDPFAVTTHRPWPLSQTPWAMAQRWHDLLFAHWPISAAQIAAKLPPGLTLDTYEGEAWLAVVPFRMSHVRPRYVTSVPWLSHFPELNVRTYVRVGDHPGVFFFSLDAGNPVAVALARAFFHLPYFRARMDMSTRAADQTVSYRSVRTHGRAASAHFVGSYRPVSETRQVMPGSFEHWLIERYALYSVDRRGRIYRGEIHHQPWPIQTAEADISVNTLATAAGLTLPDIPPLLHFARRLDVVAWAIQPVKT
ncbi:MAG: DUF2071 domain-containing protein [Caldilineaceae bacterium]